MLTPLPPLPKMWVVLVIPEIPGKPGKTGRMYAALKPGHFTDGRITDKLISALHNNDFNSSMLFNTFENIAFDSYSGLSDYKERLIKLGALQVHLAGSGPTLFTMFEGKSQAEDLYARCKSREMQAYLASTGFKRIPVRKPARIIWHS